MPESSTTSVQHTPGPWLLEEDGRIIKEELRNGVVHRSVLVHHVFGRGNEHLGEWQANARLMASAPDMLAALKAVLGKDILFDAAFESARAAIAKAEGRLQ